LFSTKIDSIEVKFSLSEFVPILIVDSINDPKLITIQKEGKEYLTEIHFVIPTQDVDLAESVGRRKVRLLCNLISYKCRRGIIPIYKGYRLIYTDGHSSSAGVAPFKIWQDNDLELSADEIKKVEIDPNRSTYQHFSRSFIALLKHDDDVIAQFA
jgi:hypothetical protein